MYAKYVLTKLLQSKVSLKNTEKEIMCTVCRKNVKERRCVSSIYQKFNNICKKYASK